jgi:hypothetical protein
MLHMLAAIPDAAILPGDAQQPPTAFAATMVLWLNAGWSGDAVGGILLQLSDKGRWPGVRGKDRQCMSGAGHRNVHDAPFFGILVRLILW